MPRQHRLYFILWHHLYKMWCGLVQRSPGGGWWGVDERGLRCQQGTARVQALGDRKQVGEEMWYLNQTELEVMMVILYYSGAKKTSGLWVRECRNWREVKFKLLERAAELWGCPRGARQLLLVREHSRAGHSYPNPGGSLHTYKYACAHTHTPIQLLLRDKWRQWTHSAIRWRSTAGSKKRLWSER